MSDDKKKTTKLTLGASKLSLGRRSSVPKKLTKTLGKSGAVVVEIKHGKVVGKDLTIDNRKVPADGDSNIHDQRRISALEKAKESKSDEKPKINTLSVIAQMNQKPKAVDELSSQDSDNSGKKEHSRDRALHSKDEKKYDSKPEEEKTIPVKPKTLEPKKLKKSDIIHMLDQDSGDAPFKSRSLASLKRARAKERRKNLGDAVKAEKVYREVIIPEVITVTELANRMSEKLPDVTKELMKLGIMATGTQSIDSDTAEIVATSLGHSVKHVKESDIENILTDIEDDEANAESRAPIVTIMGHVDHGKTSLLDALKSTDIASSEAGGITQHIGAYNVTISDDKMITFIDTPGHEAFTEMRTRGANITDIVVLVVAADDGIKAQTIEAISHAKAADVPIIVAINKIDKEGADTARVKNELLTHELVPEDLGGDVITVEVSAATKQNLDKLEEAILLLAEMQELKANPSLPASGVVIESRVHQSKGTIATVIVQKGTLRIGDLVIAGKSYGRIKNLCNDKGHSVQKASPSIAVELYGLNDSPSAGDSFNVVKTDKQAREIVDYRIRKAKNSKVTAEKTSLEDLFLKASGESKIKEIPMIIKCDVQGSAEAIISTLEKIESDEVKVKVLHSAVGAITESDIMLATASGALVVGFNVRANNAASAAARADKIDVRYYSIIYNLIDDVKSIMSGMLSPILREEYIGSVDIREVFNISKVGKIAGSYVTKGIIKRGASVRLLRENVVIHEGTLKTLKRFKEDVKEVREGFECGIAFENYSDIKIDDSVEVFEVVEEQKKL
ncbi:translation initiation factor IF-2 [Rickettsiaceae bacterium]|nr:translation initiation factor IF-2 [Rickettsiaceae bacterium]